MKQGSSPDAVQMTSYLLALQDTWTSGHRRKTVGDHCPQGVPAANDTGHAKQATFEKDMCY